MGSDLKGVCTPICTIFSEDGARVDEAATEKHVDTLLEAGVHIIAACGGTGEFSFLRAEERRRVAELIARRIDARAKLIVHTSAVLTEETIEHSQHAEGLGADALLVLPPYFEGPTLDGVYEHYERLAAVVRVPIMAYNIPLHTGIDLTPEFIARLESIDTVRYLKDSTGDFLRLQALIAQGTQVFVGADPLMLHGLIAGASGCFWGASNAIPREAVELYGRVSAGDYDGAKSLWQRIYPLNQFVWSHPFNPSVKAAANLLGHDLRGCRRPVQPLTRGQLADLKQAVRRLSA